MNFDYVDDSNYPSINRSAHLRADSNLTYLEFIDLIKHIWDKGHPTVSFIANSSNHIADPDKGYIVYGLESRMTHKDFVKPKLLERIYDTATGHEFEIWNQIYDNQISFTAIHRVPRVAEEIIEAFEDFMVEATPIFKRLGVGDIFYSRRYSDREESRIGQDMCARTVVYRTMLQRIRKIERGIIERIAIDVRVWKEQYEYRTVDPTDYATPNITTYIVDQATPAFPD